MTSNTLDAFADEKNENKEAEKESPSDEYRNYKRVEKAVKVKIALNNCSRKEPSE